MMDFIIMMVPVLFLVLSVVVAKKRVQKGTTAKKALVFQICSFLLVYLVCFSTPIMASAAEVDIAQKVALAASVNGLGLIAAALSTGLSGIGGGIAVAAAAPAAIGATAENPQSFVKSLIFVALGEGIALYGLLVSILILNNIMKV